MADQRPGSNPIESHPDPDMAQVSGDTNPSSEYLPQAENEQSSLLVIHLALSIAARRTRGDPSTSKSTAADFLESLPIVKPEHLRDDSDICHICKEPFNDSDSGFAGNSELPVQLPCNHIMGSACLATWFHSSNSCPMCRATLFPQEASSWEPLRALEADLTPRQVVWRRRADEDRSQVLPAQVQFFRRELRGLAEENERLLTRLLAFDAVPETEGELAEVVELGRGMLRIDARLEEIEVQIRRLGREGGDR